MTYDELQLSGDPLAFLRIACARVSPGKLRLLLAAFSERLASCEVGVSVCLLASILNRYLEAGQDDLDGDFSLEFRQAARRLIESAGQLDQSPATATNRILAELKRAWPHQRLSPPALCERLIAPIREIVPPMPAPRLPAGWIRWGRGQLLRLARQIQQEQSFEELPVLADALQDAGVEDPRILAHCREARQHHRGCWVLALFVAEGR
jgi:hypothetical protein